MRPGAQHVFVRRRLGLLIVGSSSLGIVGFPIAPIDLAQRYAGDGLGVYAVRIDAVPIRMRSGHIEGLDPTGGAEQVLGGTCVECVGGQRILARNKFEAICRDNQVFEASACTHRAIAHFQN
jgi:hypothetical protein